MFICSKDMYRKVENTNIKLHLVHSCVYKEDS